MAPGFGPVGLALGGSIVSATAGPVDGDRPAAEAAPGDHGAVGDALVEAVATALAGRLGDGARRLAALADDPEVPLPTTPAARVTLTAVHAVAGRLVPGEIDDLVELVELADVPWLSALAQAATGLAGGGGSSARSGWRPSARPRAIRGAARPPASSRCSGPWRPAGRRWASWWRCAIACGSSTGAVECWCRAWLATAMARAGDGRAREVARAAERDAAEAEVPGAQAWALAVQALLAEGDEARELAGRAEAVRHRWGVDVPVLAIDPAAAAPAAPRPGRCGRAGRACVSAASAGSRSSSTAGRSTWGRSSPGPGRRCTCWPPTAAAGPRREPGRGLWPDMEAAAGKRNLQVAISSLRRLLDDHSRGGSALVRRDGPAYVLALPDVGCADVACSPPPATRPEAVRHGDEALVLDAGDRALVAYGGDLLPEQGPADWAVGYGANWPPTPPSSPCWWARRRSASAATTWRPRRCARGLDIDRYHDGLWRLLVHAQEAGGDLAAAACSTGYHDMLRELGSTPRCAGTPWPRPQIRPWRSA